MQQHALGTVLGGVNVYTDDPERLARFYSEVLGVEAIGGGIYYEIASPEATIGITSASLAPGSVGASARAAVELTVEVPDADDEYARLAHLDGWESSPAWYPWARVARLRDPDGNVISLQERAPSTSSWSVRDWRRTRVVDQLYWHLREAWWWMRQVLDGLTDDEFFWEPVADCWTIRDVGGTWVADLVRPEPVPPPVTTIAWRLTHVRSDLEGFGRSAFPSGESDPIEIVGNADDAVAAVRKAVRYLRERLLASDDDDMRGVVHEGRTYPVWATVSHAIVEATHHTAEIGVLRDLYKRREG